MGWIIGLPYRQEKVFIITLSRHNMPTIRHPRIVRPGVLSGLKRTSILALLSPFADYFAARGAPLDKIGDDNVPLDDMVSVITSPVESTPPDLVERLELLDLISGSQSTINFEDGYERLDRKSVV